MQLTPDLSFNGHCKAAFKFYEQCLGGQLGTSWAARFGMVIDRFGIPWLINERSDGSPEG